MEPTSHELFQFIYQWIEINSSKIHKSVRLFVFPNIELATVGLPTLIDNWKKHVILKIL